MVERSETRTFVRLQGHNLKSKLSSFYASTLESKVARTFTDDADIYHGTPMRHLGRHRPGQRDDESRCTFGKMLPV